MNAPFKQLQRLGRLTTVLGQDELVLLRFDGTDHLNDLFEFRVEALATHEDVDFDALIGTHATVEIEGREASRPFDGIVTQARWAGVGENGHRYDLTLRPWFWLAGRRRNQRIFHNKTVVQIIQELLSDYAQLGDPALEIKLNNDYPVLEYTVQYRESDLDFARRQMERHGISFHFKHAQGSHTLVLTDDVLAHETIGARPYKRYDGHHQPEGEHFWEWAPERNLTTGAIRLTDYNFKKPDQAMEADRIGDAAYAQGQIESFDYPGDYPAQSVGKIVAGLRAHQERGSDRRNRAIGDTLSLGAGKIVELSGDPVPGSGERYLCLSAVYHFVSEAYGSGDETSDGYSFTGSYTLTPDTAPMVPPRKTFVPAVQGPQTAAVVGDGEIDCDEYGRILVRFHWDLEDAFSMRCRVSQNWAGNGWGGMVIPRIGMEVVVEFLEGDPDKPIVIGNVFNGKNGTPYELPKHKTRSTFKTKSHDGQGAGIGFNELRFEDDEGQQEIFIHAQRDLHIGVQNDQRRSIGGHSHEQVRENKTEIIYGEHVSHSASINVMSSSDSILIASGSMPTVRPLPESAFMTGAEQLRDQVHYRGNLSDVRGAEKGSFLVHSSADLILSSDGESHIHSDRSISLTSLDTMKLSSPSNVKISAQDHIIAEASQGIVLASPSGIVLQSGLSKIILSPDGSIKINGSLVTVNGRNICLS